MPAFLMNTDDSQTASINLAANATWQTGANVFHFTGASVGAGTFCGAGSLYDDGTTPFEQGRIIDTLRKLGPNIDSNLAGEVTPPS